VLTVKLTCDGIQNLWEMSGRPALADLSDYHQEVVLDRERPNFRGIESGFLERASQIRWYPCCPRIPAGLGHPEYRILHCPQRRNSYAGHEYNSQWYDPYRK
jgi:hypothetical protein